LVAWIIAYPLVLVSGTHPGQRRARTLLRDASPTRNFNDFASTAQIAQANSVVRLDG
jgi:hypothetical protein